MNCDCKKTIEEKAVKEMEWKGKKVVRAELQGMLVFGTQPGFYSSTSLMVYLEGQKKRVDIEVAHTYCPFCGVKAKKEEEISEPKK